jgi:hypothetical protein
MVPDGEVAHVALQTNPTAANVTIACVIAPFISLCHCRVESKEAESAA